MNPILPRKDLVHVIEQSVQFCTRDFNVRASPGGNMVELKYQPGGNADGSCPFDAALSPGESEGTFIFRFTRPGEFAPAGLPTNMFEDGKLFEADVSNNTFIKLEVTTTGTTVTSTRIIIDSDSAPAIGISTNVAPVTFEVNLYAISGGKLFRLFPCGDFYAQPQLAITTDKEEPDCADDPFIRHYTWEVDIRS